jgi:two-component system NtrC family sensor kinase
MSDLEPEGTAERLARFEQEVQRLQAALDESQRQLARTQRLAALGTLLVGIAHEIKTPVAAVNSAQDMLSRVLDRLKEALEQASPGICAERSAVGKALQGIANASGVIRSGSARTLEIIQRVRRAAQDDAAGVAWIDLRVELDETLQLLDHEMKRRIEVVRDYGSIPAIAGDRTALGQVLLNVLLNAIQAVPDQGTVTVRTEAQPGAVHVVVEDTGVGIAPEHISRIFEKGFSTKPQETGSGLGLSISRELVERHGGRIELESEPGRGTRVTIVLPT